MGLRVRGAWYRRRSSRVHAVWAGAAAAISLAAGACTFDAVGFAGEGAEADASMVVADAANPPPADASEEIPDAPPPEPAGHLLLTEVKTQPTANEFIEIWNPLDEEQALDGYYLSDSSFYARLPAGSPTNIGNGDAVLEFPEGATLAPGQVIVIARDEQGFRQSAGRDPDYAIVPAASGPVAQPMASLAGGNTPMNITDIGEPIILFRWDEASDLVTDVDIVVVGNDPPAANAPNGNGLPDKTDLALDGPDRGAQDSTYAADSADMPAMSYRAGNMGSYQRIAPEGDFEARGGGNGVDGHDETDEDTSQTWAQVDGPATPGELAGTLRP
jgi:uncharacterized protein